MFMDDQNEGGSETKQATAMVRYLNKLFTEQRPSLSDNGLSFLSSKPPLQKNYHVPSQERISKNKLSSCTGNLNTSTYKQLT